MKLQKQNVKLFIIAFAIIFTVSILKDRYIGVTYKFNINPIVPLSWGEIYNNIVSYIFLSSILSLIFTFLYNFDHERKNRKKNQNDSNII